MLIKLIVIAFLAFQANANVVTSVDDDFEKPHNDNPTNISFKDSEERETREFGLNKALVSNDCSHISFQSRELWGARPYYDRKRLELPVNKIFFDVSQGNRCYNFPQCAFFVRHLQNFHMDTVKISDIDFNFLVGDDARVYIGRGYDTQRDLNPKFNTNSLLIGFLGSLNNVPFISPKVLHTFHKIIRCGQLQGFIADNYTIYEASRENCNRGLSVKVYQFLAQARLTHANFACSSR